MMDGIESQINTMLTANLVQIKRGISDRMQYLGRNASGRSVRSLSVEIAGGKGALIGDAQWSVMESGRKGGKVPRNFTEIIKKWIQDKGISISSSSNLNSAAYLISRSIMKNGTVLYRKGSKDDIIDSVVEAQWKKIQDDASFVFESSIDTINDKFVRKE